LKAPEIRFSILPNSSESPEVLYNSGTAYSPKLSTVIFMFAPGWPRPCFSDSSLENKISGKKLSITNLRPKPNPKNIAAKTTARIKI
jgi:hypothetical protein